MSRATRDPIRLYRYALSGHAHRAELMLSLLGLPYESVDVDLRQGEQKRAEFLALNPFGQVPVIQDGAHTVADSGAILAYLSRRYDASNRWWPVEPVAAAQVQRWLSVAAGPLVDGPARARVQVVFGRPREAICHQVAAHLFTLMEQHLAGTDYLAGRTPTVADVAMYTYTAHAPEGGIGLGPYPAIRAWLARVEALPGFVGMQRSPEAEALLP
jgi:glutathione S-transferase